MGECAGHNDGATISAGLCGFYRQWANGRFCANRKDRLDLALRIAQERGDQKMVGKLVAQGEPPYYSDSIILDTIRYLQYLDGEVAARGQVHAPKSSLYASILAPEYGLVDKYNWITGLF